MREVDQAVKVAAETFLCRIFDDPAQFSDILHLDEVIVSAMEIAVPKEKECNGCCQCGQGNTL